MYETLSFSVENTSACAGLRSERRSRTDSAMGAEHMGELLDPSDLHERRLTVLVQRDAIALVREIELYLRVRLRRVSEQMLDQVMVLYSGGIPNTSLPSSSAATSATLTSGFALSMSNSTRVAAISSRLSRRCTIASRREQPHGELFAQRSDR